MIRRAIEFLGRVVTGSGPQDDAFPSVVLLLDSARPLTRENVLQLAVQAWGSSDDGPALARSPDRGTYRIRVSNLIFALRSARGRYEAPGPETNVVRQRAWDQHGAWLAVEYPEGSKTPESEWPSCYKLLFLMVNQLWDEHCLGLYLPVQGITVPNMGDLIASIRWAGKNGTPLPFLHDN